MASRTAYWSQYKKMKSKYGAKRTDLDGYSFASKLEASVYGLLKLRQKAGELWEIQVQDHIYLSEARILYVADFRATVVKTGKAIWIEAKGIETPAYKIKLKLWRAYGPGDLEIFKGTHIRPILVETVRGAC